MLLNFFLRNQSLVRKLIGGLNAFLLFGLTFILLHNATFQLGFSNRIVQSHLTISSSIPPTIKPAHLQLTFYRSAADAGEEIKFLDQGYSLPFDTGLGLYYGFLNQQQTQVQAISGHACTALTYKQTGVLASVCNLPKAGLSTKQICYERCLINANATTKLPVYDSNYEIAEYFRLKNSVGFGVIFTRQTITHVEMVSKVSLKTPGKLHFYSKIATESRDNSKDWQTILFVFTCTVAFVNILIRFAAVAGLYWGIRFDKQTYTVIADLPGGLFTSPGVSWTSLGLVIMSCQNWVAFEATAGIEDMLMVDLFTSCLLTSMTCFVIQFLLNGSGVRLYNSGSSIFWFAYLSRWITHADNKKAAFTQVRKLGMVLIRECKEKRLNVNGQLMTEGVVDCSVSDGVGLSGIEIFVKLYFEAFLFCLLFVVSSEILIFLFRCRRNVVSPSSRSKHTIGPPRSIVPSSAEQTTDSNQSKKGKFENIILLSGKSRSVFCGLWTKPLDTKIGRFFTLSSMIEDNLVLHGPLLLTLDYAMLSVLMSFVVGRNRATQLIISYKLYAGVQIAPNTIESVRNNGIKIPPFVQEFDYVRKGGILNPEPIAG